MKLKQILIRQNDEITESYGCWFESNEAAMEWWQSYPKSNSIEEFVADIKKKGGKLVAIYRNGIGECDKELSENFRSLYHR